MSVFEEFLKKHCPDGVEYKQIKDIAKINRGIIISKKYIEENKGDYPVYSSQTENNGELGRINNYAYDGEYLTWTTDGANAGSVFYRNEKFNITNVCGLIKITEDNIITKFVYYILHIYAPKYVNRGMGNCKLMSNVMESISIPIPPIEVQEEIVRILDEFSEKTNKLQELLHRETILRKKQYEYYRDKLLTFTEGTQSCGDEVEWKKLPEIADTFIGLVTTMTKNYSASGVPLIFNSSIKENKFVFNKRVYLNETFAKKNEQKRHKIGDIISVHTGDVGTSAIIDEKLDGSIGFATIVTRIKDNSKVYNKYICYFLNSRKAKSQISSLIKGDRDNLNLKDFNKIIVPIPPLEEQERIVKILDQFDTLCNDITRGLPAEIELRKKQYEYYRDKLLTFKEKKK